MRAWIRWMLLAVGTASVALGVVGIMVPLLPTTPLLLLAAFCSARSPERFYHWLMDSPCLGGYSGTTGPAGAYPCCRRC